MRKSANESFCAKQEGGQTGNSFPCTRLPTKRKHGQISNRLPNLPTAPKRSFSDLNVVASRGRRRCYSSPLIQTTRRCRLRLLVEKGSAQTAAEGARSRCWRVANPPPCRTEGMNSRGCRVTKDQTIEWRLQWPSFPAVSFVTSCRKKRRAQPEPTNMAAAGYATHSTRAMSKDRNRRCAE